MQIWGAFIEYPIEMLHLISTGNLVEETPKSVADIDCYPGTPLMFSFASNCIVLTCEPNAIIGVRQFPRQFDLDVLFHRDPVDYEDGCFIAQQPIWHFLQGPFGHCFHDQGGLRIDRIDFIARKDSGDTQSLAGMIFSFHDGIRFGISAAHESHFCYCYNDHCDQLSKEARSSINHVVASVVRKNAEPRSPDSMLLMVE